MMIIIIMKTVNYLKEEKSMSKYTKEMFVKKANEIHNCKYDYSKSDYKNSYTKIIIICHNHNKP